MTQANLYAKIISQTKQSVCERRVNLLKINLVSVFVNDIYKALEFYTEILGFKEKTVLTQIGYFTVTSPTCENEVELLLEPNSNPIAESYQKELFKQGIPAVSFGSDNVTAEYGRLTKLGVKFHMKPKKVVGAMICVLEDGCGNLIQIAEVLHD